MRRTFSHRRTMLFGAEFLQTLSISVCVIERKLTLRWIHIRMTSDQESVHHPTHSTMNSMLAHRRRTEWADHNHRPRLHSSRPISAHRGRISTQKIQSSRPRLKRGDNQTIRGLTLIPSSNYRIVTAPCASPRLQPPLCLTFFK